MLAKHQKKKKEKKINAIKNKIGEITNLQKFR